MPSFGAASTAQLATCDERLQRIAAAAIQHFDFTVVEGHRDQAAQHADFLAGRSKLDWPHGNHNASPSRAMDIMPYPIDWSDNTKAIARVAFLMGVIKVCADDLGIKVRFGFDWNRNLDPRDETFLDWDHVELDEP